MERRNTEFKVLIDTLILLIKVVAKRPTL